MELHANDQHGRTTTFDISMSVHKDATWVYEVECNGIAFLVETIINPDPRHLVEAILDRYQSIRADHARHAAQIRKELDRGIF